MTSTSSTAHSALHTKINLKIQDASPFEPPKSAFTKIWLEVKGDYEAMRRDLKEYISHQLAQNHIRAELYSRVKTMESIAKSIDRRENNRIELWGGKYDNPRQILDDIHDLVGFRIVADFQSGLEKCYAWIEKTFRMERDPHLFTSDRPVGSHWKPMFGAYEARNYQVRLDRSFNAVLAVYQGVLFEIQVTSVAESLYNRLAHPLHYKRAPGSLSRQDEMIIDLSHGLALCYWISLSCMEGRLGEDAEAIHRQPHLPDTVRGLAGCNHAEMDMDALVKVTPDIPAVSQVSRHESTDRMYNSKRRVPPDGMVSIDLLLNFLGDLPQGTRSGAEIWQEIKSKLGLSDGNKEIPLPLPIVMEACFDSKDLESSPKCYAGTRIGVRSMIRSWVDDMDAQVLFWLYAPAGTGKSTLARTLVDDLEIEGRLAAGYFFKRGDNLRNGTARIFTTIADQLIRTIPSYEQTLRQSLRGSAIDGIEKRSLREQFETLIRKPLKRLPPLSSERPPMVIIIDALDECICSMDVPRILSLFASLKHLDTLRLCVFFSSRRTPPLSSAFGDITAGENACRVLALHEEFCEATKSDIEVVLRDGLEDVKKRRGIKREPWPEPGDFAFILSQATTPSPLFIYISTLLRYISKGNATQRFENWVTQGQDTVSQLDQIYMPIMAGIFRGEEGDADAEPLTEQERSELGYILAILALLSHPLPVSALYKLLDLDEDSVRCWLGALHAVIRVPDDEGSPVELIHKSFADFLLWRHGTDTTSFRVDISKTHKVLAELCMNRLRNGLHKNLCELENPAIDNDDYEEDAVARSIPADLEYACVNWVDHLVRSRRPIDVEVVNSLLKKHLLHWFEALSLLGELPEAGKAIRQLLNLPQLQRLLYVPEASLVGLLRDAQRFIRRHGQHLQRYPMQVYGGCLVLSPHGNRVRQLFLESSNTRLASIRSIKGGLDAWGPLLSSITPIDPVKTIAVSPDGHWVAANTKSALQLADVGSGIFFQEPPVELPNHDEILAQSIGEDEEHVSLSAEGHVYFSEGSFLHAPTGSPNHQCTLAKSGRLKCATIHAKFSLVAAVVEGDDKRYSLGVWDAITGDLGLDVKSEVLDDIENISLAPISQTDYLIGLISHSGKIHAMLQLERATPKMWYVGHHPVPSSQFPVTRAIAASCSGVLATSANNEIRLWSWDKMRTILQLRFEDSYVYGARCMAFSPTGTELAVGGKHLAVYEVPTQLQQETARQEHSPQEGGRIISPTLFDVISTTLFDVISPTVSDVISPTLFDVERRSSDAMASTQYMHISNPGRIERAILSPDRRTLATTSNTHPLLLWDIEQGILNHEIHFKLPLQSLGSYVFSSDGGMLAVTVATGQVRQVHFLKLENSTATFQEKKISSLADSMRPSLCPLHPSHLAFSPDAKTLATFGYQKLSLWEVATGECRWSLDVLLYCDLRLEFSPDGARLLVISKGIATLLEVSRGTYEARANLDSWVPAAGHIQSVSFSATGESIGMALDDEGDNREYRFLLWDVRADTVRQVDASSIVDPQLKQAYDSIFQCQRWIHGGRPLLSIPHSRFPVAIAKDRLVITQRDGEFTVVDFDLAWLNEI